jgi:lipoprotein-anchoring transpeptidase ErfK/SrfK
LSGRQSHLRPGWAGGDRVAIHGGSVGGAASAGCIHANDADLIRLMKVVPIGTPVYIQS